MSKLFDPLASYVTMPSSAESTNYINGDFAPDHKGDYRKGIAVTSEEITGDLSDDNLPFALKTEFKEETKASDTNKDAATAIQEALNCKQDTGNYALKSDLNSYYK